MAAGRMMLQAALEYALAGLPVFPLHSATDGRCSCGKPDCTDIAKHPRTPNGLTDASTDPEIIAGWWRRWPDANVALCTGLPAGLAVLDIDPRHGGNKSLERLERKHGRLPRGPLVLTGSGGTHRYFADPEGKVSNSTGKLGDGIDVRGDGGYVVAPPSIHKSGNPYKWLHELNGSTPAWPLADAFPAEPTRAAPIEEEIPAGKRNETLTSLAGSIRRPGMSEAEILAALRVANRDRCKPPLDDSEVKRIAESIAKKTPAPLEDTSSNSEPKRTLRARSLTDVEMRSIEWLEKPLWQRSAFQLLAGPKGCGKGTYLAGLAARRTLAGDNAVFVSTEDSTAIDLKPRLVAAGADIERCFDIPLHVELPDDVYELEKLALDLGGVGLLVIDPVANHIGDSDSNGDTAVRYAISPLNWLADELDCLLIGVRHPGKDRSRGAVASILGSTAWVDTPRAVVFIAPDDEDETVRHVQVVAGNRSLNGSAQAFRIDAVDVPGLTEPITLAVDLGASSKSVDDLIAAGRTESRTGQARELILDILENEGNQESDALDARVAQETGLAAQTIRNTRAQLKNDGLIKSIPEKDENGTIERWIVSRTQAPRP